MVKSKLKINFPKSDEQPGIWQFSSYLSPLPDEFKLSLSEGNTQEITFGKDLILKREDENPTGSLKDRGMAYLISQAFFSAEKNLVLPSSGNAAISAAAYSSLAKIKFYAFVSPKINKNKLKKIERTGAEIYVSPRPVSESVRFAQKKHFFNLRPSLNCFGPEGYQTISFELAINHGFIEDIFIPVSSGVCLLGVVRGFKKIGFLPRIHACQGAAVHPVASFFDKDFKAEKKSLASALVAKYTPLKSEVIKVIKESGGFGWVIGSKEIVSAQKSLEEKGILTSEEGALSLAAWRKAKVRGLPLGKSVCLLTGSRY